MKKANLKPGGNNGFVKGNTHGIYIEGIRGIYIGKSPIALYQYLGNELFITTKAEHNRNISFPS